MKSMSNLFAFSIALLLHLIFQAGSLFIQHESVKRRSALLPVHSQLSFPSPTVACGARFLERCFIYTSRHGLNSFNVNSRTVLVFSFYIEWEFLIWCRITVFKTELPYLLFSHIILDCMKQIYPVLLIGCFLLFVNFCYYEHTAVKSFVHTLFHIAPVLSWGTCVEM